MKKLLSLLSFSFALMACTGNTQTTPSAQPLSADSVEVAAAPVAEQPLLVCDSAMNRAARFYAGISCEGVELTAAQRASWDAYSRKMASYVTSSRRITDPMDTLMTHDMTDLREACDYVFYPFSGPDFLYPITLFPNADTYFMAGLENTGSPLSEISAQSSRFNGYTKALEIFMRSSFFRTKSMDKDLDNAELDGTVPVISMLMAVRGYQIVGVSYKQWTAEGAMTDAPGVSNLAEIRFFNPATPRHLQTLYYLSDDLSDAKFDERVGRYLQATLPQHHVVTFLKAASYLLHQTFFTKMRDHVASLTDALVGDDSGMPYRYLKDDFDITLYGKYMRPISIFGDHDYQRDLLALYDSVEVRPLPFRIGYNNPSNWMAARRRQK